jgi:hypothetical protein
MEIVKTHMTTNRSKVIKSAFQFFTALAMACMAWQCTPAEEPPIKLKKSAHIVLVGNKQNCEK